MNTDKEREAAESRTLARFQAIEPILESTYICCIDQGCGEDCEAVVAGAVGQAYDAASEASAERIETLTRLEKEERERREELEVVAAALYLGHDDAKQQFDEYRAVYLNTGPLALGKDATTTEAG